MADATTQPGEGDVEIELEGKKQILVPSLKACIDISSIAGGLNAAAQRVAMLDFDTICQIIVAGLGLNPRQAQAVPKAVFETGLMALSGPCVDFLNIIGNGGRPIEEEEGEGDGDLDPPLPA